jgi:hypothetical protein
MAADAVAVARDVASRLREPSRVELALERCQADTRHPTALHWRSDAVAQGHAGLAILWAAADGSFPDEGWDKVGHEHLTLAARAAEQRTTHSLGMQSGVGGLAFAAWRSSRRGTRYVRLLRSLDDAVIRQVRFATRAGEDGRHGVPVSLFDAISGLAGVGRYLLLRADDTRCRAALDATLRALVALMEEEDGVPRWHTPPHLTSDDGFRREFQHGMLNCGLAHGIPGPLALLSVAAMNGAVVDGQLEAIRHTAERLCQWRHDDQWGANWPVAVPLDAVRPFDAGISHEARAPYGPAPSRAAWCYGSPGIARALWLAGTALDDSVLRTFAIDSMAAVYARPVARRRIDSPTFCHGVAGLQQITLRFANDTGLPMFVDAADTLCRQLLDAFEAQSLLGYRHIEAGGQRIDQPGLLDGAAGVAMVLLAGATPVDPSWDALFLLS